MTAPDLMDCFDLNDWFLVNRPEFYQATKYLPPSAQFELFRKEYTRLYNQS